MSLLSDTARAQLASGMVHLAFLVELDFVTGIERYWTGLHALQHDGHEWLGVGNMGSVSPIQSSEDFHANGLELGIYGLPGDALRNVRGVRSSDYKGRPARFIFAFMDANFQNVIHSLQRFYFIDRVDYFVDPDNGAACVVALETEVRKASRATQRRYTDSDQKNEFPGDRGFEFVPYLNSGVEAKWGTKGSFFK